MRAKDTSREAEAIQLDICRRMGPVERLQRALDLSQTCRALMREGVRQRHPEYDEQQVQLAVIRLTLPEKLFVAAYPKARDIAP